MEDEYEEFLKEREGWEYLYYSYDSPDSLIIGTKTRESEGWIFETSLALIEQGLWLGKYRRRRKNAGPSNGTPPTSFGGTLQA